jgi:hypothetical protein
MQATGLLESWFADATSGDALIDPLEIQREAVENLRYLAIPRGHPVPDIQIVEAVVARVVEARREHLRARTKRSMTMYWWHDVLAGQLRCSLVCSSHRRLPFRARVRHVACPRPILEEWLTSPWLQGIPWTDLECEPDAESEDAPVRETIRVWSVVLRASRGAPTALS